MFAHRNAQPFPHPVVVVYVVDPNFVIDPNYIIDPNNKGPRFMALAIAARREG